MPLQGFELPTHHDQGHWYHTPASIKTHGFLTRDHPVPEVGGSNPGRGTMVGGGFHPASILARFSPPNMPYIVNSKSSRIIPRGEAVNYRPYASPSFEVATARKTTAISAFVIVLYTPAAHCAALYGAQPLVEQRC